MKKRVYELAREYGMKGADLVKMLKSLGYTKAKTHMAVLDDADLIQVQALLEINGKIPEQQEEVPVAAEDEDLGFFRKKSKKPSGAPAADLAAGAESAVDEALEAALAAALAPAEATSEDVTSEEVTSETVASEEMTAEAVSSEAVSPEAVSSEAVTSGEADLAAETSEAMATEGVISESMAPDAPVSEATVPEGIAAEEAAVEPATSDAVAAESTDESPEATTAEDETAGEPQPALATDGTTDVPHEAAGAAADPATIDPGEIEGAPVVAETTPEEPLEVAASAEEESQELLEPTVAESTESSMPTTLETPLEVEAADTAAVGEAKTQPKSKGEAKTKPKSKGDSVRQKSRFVAPRPSRPKRQAKILGRIDLEQAKPPRPSQQPPMAPSGPRPTMGRDRSKMFVRGAGGSRDAMTQQQLRDRERSRVQRRARPMPRGRDRGRGKTDPNAAAASRPEKAVVEHPINVKSLSQAIGVKISQLMLKLLQMTKTPYNMNSPLDEETAVIVAGEFRVELEVKKTIEAETALLEAVEEAKASATKDEQAQMRAPVIAFLGHVDHGKTSLLDYIRHSRVTAGEAGGITQHIGAYQVSTPQGNLLTILDTPGHEAFTAMRARGANTTDIVVLVVACDDGVMPQTEEAIQHAKAAGTPIVVALNKIDRPEANSMRVKQQLSTHGIQGEDWGGNVQMVETSAITGQGMDELLETIDLVATAELELTAHPHVNASGTVLEAEVSEGRGILARLLVQDGTLKRGDILLAGEGYGRVRAIYNDLREEVQEAPPSSPIEVIGLSAIPSASDRFYVVEDLAKAREVAEERAHKARAMLLAERSAPRRSLSDLLSAQAAGQDEQKELRLVLRADVQGSVEALRKSLEELTTDAIKLELLQVGVGAITESDVNLAAASDAGILGFHVSTDEKARGAAEKLGIDIRTYQIIYELLDDVRAAMEDRLSPILNERVIGHAEIRQLFSFSKIGKIGGCMVTDGIIRRSAKVRLVREGRVIYSGKIASLRRVKEDARDVREGFECGITIENYDDIKVGDIIESFVIEEERRTL